MMGKNSAAVRKKKCLIVYHFFAYYRLHILRELMHDEEWEFEMVSDATTVAGIKGIDPELSNVRLEEGGLRWTFVKNRPVLGRRLPFLWQSGLLARIRQDDYDAIIFLGSIYFISTWAALHVAKGMGKRVLFWTHGFLGKDGALLNCVRHLFYRQADCCLLYGEKAQKIMVDSGYYKPEQLRVIYNSLDYEPMERCRSLMTSLERSKLRRALFGSDDVPVVVAVGRVNRVKRFDLLLRAIALLREREVSCRCLIVGDGAELKVLKELALELALEDWVEFYGAAYGDEADRLLLASDLCVIPGDVGLSAMHAMSAGLPVISHDNFTRQMPEHEAIVEGETGSFYEYESIEDLASCIRGWVADARLLESARECCFRKVGTHFHARYQVRVIKESLVGLQDD